MTGDPVVGQPFPGRALRAAAAGKIRTIVGALAFVMTTGSVMVPTAAASQPPSDPEPDAAERARRLRDQAFELLARGRYEAAIQKLQSAYAEVPDPGFLLNIAIAEQRAGRCGRALETFDRFREACGPDCRYAREAQAKQAEIRQACLSTVVVRSQPGGLPVMIDGQAAGRTPLHLTRRPGPMRVETASAAAQIVLAGGDRAWIETLVAEPPPAPDRARPAFRRGLAWGTAGLGAFGLVLGSTFLGLSSASDGARDEARAAGAPPGEVRALGARHDRNVAVAVTGLTVATLSAVASGLLFWSADRLERTQRAAGGRD